MNSPDHKSMNPVTIDADLVDRVFQRTAMGIPLRIALAGEGVNQIEYKDALLKDPELAVLEDVAKRKFLETAFGVILDGENVVAAANYRWLIELVYKDTIGSGSPQNEPENQKQTILGLPNELLERIRTDARNAR